MDNYKAMKKTDYLTGYDYGMGGVWAIVRARSPEEITKKFPDLKVVNSRPSWMTDEYYKKVLDRFQDIDEPPSGWFALLKYNP
jgi:hypothetical protein